MVSRSLNSISFSIMTGPVVYILGMDYISSVIVVVGMALAIYKSSYSFSFSDSAMLSGFVIAFSWIVYLDGEAERYGQFNVDYFTVFISIISILSIINGIENSINSDFYSKKFLYGLKRPTVTSFFIVFFIAMFFNTPWTYGVDQFDVLSYMIFIVYFSYAMWVFGGFYGAASKYIFETRSVSNSASALFIIIFILSTLIVGINTIMIFEIYLESPIWDNPPFECNYKELCPENRALAAISSISGLSFGSYHPTSGESMVLATVYSLFGYIWAIMSLYLFLRRFSPIRERN